ncbi:MAG: potassium channel family protein [Romboutsia sp.]
MTCKWISDKDEDIRCKNEADKSGYCILHKHNKNNIEKKEFIKKIKDNKINDFRGMVFEEEFNINEVIDYEYNKLIFSESIFTKDAIFSKYEFKSNIEFKYVKFENKVSFHESVFNNNCSFYKTTFNEDYINEKIFEKSVSKGQNFTINKVENLPRMDGIRFNSCTKFILKNIDYKKESYLNGKINYNIARNQANKIGDHEMIGHYYYKERAYRSKIMKASDYPSNRDYLSEKFFDILSKYTIGYGERPWNVFIIAILIISIFAFLYMFLGIKTINNELIGIDKNNYNLVDIIKIYIDLWYFSMVTFSTVGYGDMIVTSIIGKILVGLEVFLGVTIGATWASVIIKRMIR